MSSPSNLQPNVSYFISLLHLLLSSSALFHLYTYYIITSFFSPIMNSQSPQVIPSNQVQAEPPSTQTMEQVCSLFLFLYFC